MTDPNPAQAPVNPAGHDERVQPGRPLSGEVNREGTPPRDSAQHGAMIYGALPEDLGLVDLSPLEMMCWLYCPIKTPGFGFCLPANLEQFYPLIDRIMARGPDRFIGSKYVYLTAKTLWVQPGNIGNRPGWHSDGFGTDDINYIWYDRAPTEFVEDSYTLPEDCADAMARMTERAKGKPPVTFPAKHLLRLTPSVIHRSPEDFEPGMRTFVKVSVSRDRYNLEGNSINHALGERWRLLKRRSERNHPHDTAERYAGAK